MRSNALYFPYIRVPESAWFTRMLLYWDQVASIIPYDYVADPNRLGEHTRSLVECGLVRQIHPSQYIGEIPSFAPAFEGYLSESADLSKRRAAFKLGKTFRIHIEKMGPIEDILRQSGLAQADNYPWFNVEQETAQDFMAYLAACLGRLDEIGADPISDERASLLPLIGGQTKTDAVDTEVDSLRYIVLEKLFPAPERPLTAEEIADFRKKFGDTLREFRRRVEREILVLAEIIDPRRRARHIEIFEDEIRDTVTEIRTRLEESGAGRTVLSKIWSVALAIPGLSPVVGLLNAIGQACTGQKKEPPPLPLAYAAHAQISLLESRD